MAMDGDDQLLSLCHCRVLSPLCSSNCSAAVLLCSHPLCSVVVWLFTQGSVRCHENQDKCGYWRLVVASYARQWSLSRLRCWWFLIAVHRGRALMLTSCVACSRPKCVPFRQLAQLEWRCWKDALCNAPTNCLLFRCFIRPPMFRIVVLNLGYCNATSKRFMHLWWNWTELACPNSAFQQLALASEIRQPVREDHHISRWFTQHIITPSATRVTL